MRRRRGLTGGGQTVIKDTLANDLIDRYNTAVCVCVCVAYCATCIHFCAAYRFLLHWSLNTEPSLFDMSSQYPVLLWFRPVDVKKVQD